jgi:protein ImuB
VLDAQGAGIVVDDRGALSAPPAQFSASGSGRELRRITAWAGPWPIDERWWDTETHRRAHRFQVVDAAGMGWLLVLETSTGSTASTGTTGSTGSTASTGSPEGQWWAEARYD